MRITNDCVQQDTISVEVNGVCSTITEIVSQTPQMDCDELMVCVGPHLVSLNDLIMDVYQYVQSAQANNVSYFMKLFNQYNMLHEYFMKCCNDLIGRLTRIEKRVNNLIVIRQIVIKEPQPVRVTNSRAPQQIVLPKPPIIISEERYVIDQTISTGYMDAYKRYDQFGNTLIDQYVFWLKTDDGFKRKLVAKEIPYSKGTPLALAWIENIKKVFTENQIAFDETSLTYKNNDVRFSFIIPKLGGRWIVSGNKVIDLNGNDLLRFLPINYNKEVDGLVLERVTKYRVDTNQRPVIGYEPVLMTYQVLNKKLNTRSIFEAGVNHWIKYS
jgi:hypothetical protein